MQNSNKKARLTCGGRPFQFVLNEIRTRRAAGWHGDDDDAGRRLQLS
jgi:hypothetical protein